MREPQPPDERARQLAQARVLSEIGRHHEAAAIVERVLAESPEHPEALQLLTHACIGLLDFERALSCADRCVAASPDDGIGHRQRASILVEMGRFEEARQSALTAVALSPEDAWAHHVLVDVLLKSSQAGAAEEAAIRLLALAPGWSGAHDSMGRAALAEGRALEAEAHFKKALEIDPESAVAMNNLGAAFLRQKKHGEAVRFFWNALRSRSQSPALQHNLRQALAGYFAHSFFLAAALLGAPIFLLSLKTGIVTNQDRAIRTLWSYYFVLGSAWLVVQIAKHRSLPTNVRDHLWRSVHLPFWAGMRDLVVFCGIVSSFFQGIYLFLWWRGGSGWAPGSPFAWRLFAAFTFWILTCYVYVFAEWVRRRRVG